MLPRPDTKLDLFAYSALAVRSGSRLNAMGVYAWYHLSALQKASRLADDSLSADERRALARTLLSDEAFALHFLEVHLRGRPHCRDLGRCLATQGHA
jgi:hypothetical protein